MKKKLLFGTSLLLALSLGLSACNLPFINNSKGEDQEQSEKDDSKGSEDISASATDSVSESSSGGSKEKQKGDENWVDYAANGSVALALDYTGKDFYVDASVSRQGC